MELWSSDRAAEHFGVTPGLGRSLLTSRGIHRISGYPAAAVRAVQLRQGNRTDLHPFDLDTALSIDDTAAAISDAYTEADRLRVFFEFLRGSDAAVRLAARYNLPGPLWTAMPERFLDRAWWISDLPSAKLLAIEWTSASFARRGIYLDGHDLTKDRATPMPEPAFDQPEILALQASAACRSRRFKEVDVSQVFNLASTATAPAVW